MKHSIFALIYVIALCACSEATSPTSPASGAAPASGMAPASGLTVVGEQLLAQAPHGWSEVFSSDNPGLRLVEFIPDGETNDNWAHKITFESSSGKPLPDPIDFLNGLAADQEGTCDGYAAFSTFSGLENGYPTSVHLLVCNRSKLLDQSQVTMIKAIKGNDNLYVVTRAQRDAPLAEGAQALTEEEIAGWSLYLRAISACDSTRPEHPCPEPGA